MTSQPIPGSESGGSPAPPQAPPADPVSGRSLHEVEIEVIDLFVSVVKLLGIPKSVGEIYGLLFMATAPLALDVLVERLRISKGSASQGLRFLRHLGADKVVYGAGTRRDHFTAEVELKRLASGFIKSELTPHLENGELRLARLENLLACAQAEGEGGHRGGPWRERVLKLNSWHRKARRFLPLVQKFLD
ncbi:MAG: GbsR/MarR family transcriptional regulator [Verrucomicrobiales bacterium]